MFRLKFQNVKKVRKSQKKVESQCFKFGINKNLAVFFLLKTKKGLEVLFMFIVLL